MIGTKLFANGLNYKHADCNGDGEITKEDIQAIELNYGADREGANCRGFSWVETRPTHRSMLICPMGLNSFPGNEFIAPIILGNGDQPVDDLYGIAFTLVFDPDIVIPSSIQMQYDPSWLGVADVNLLNFDRTFADDGRIDVALG